MTIMGATAIEDELQDNVAQTIEKVRVLHSTSYVAWRHVYRIVFPRHLHDIDPGSGAY